MEIPQISIVVPVYNVEKYLERCIDSILAQTFTDFELLLINDGSKDSSGLICDKYAEKDSRIRVFHKENEGVSRARNLGISNARGRWLCFIDSDDWIEPNMYECLLREANQASADIVICDARTVYEDGKIQADTITQLSGNQILQKSEFTPSLLLEMAGSAWRCIYKNHRYNDKLQKQKTILFPLGVKFSEDRIFNLYAFGQANKICYIKKAFYNRYMNEKSTVHRFHQDYFEACKKSMDGIEQAIRYAWEDNNELQKVYLSQFITGAIGAICNYYYKTSTLRAAERKKMVKGLCEDSQLRNAIETYGANRKSQWILDRKYSLLIAYAILANWKHGR